MNNVIPMRRTSTRYVVLYMTGGTVSSPEPRGYDSENEAWSHASKLVLDQGINGLGASDQDAIRQLHDAGEHRMAVERWRDLIDSVRPRTDRRISVNPIRVRA